MESPVHTCSYLFSGLFSLFKLTLYPVLIHLRTRVAKLFANWYVIFMAYNILFVKLSCEKIESFCTFLLLHVLDSYENLMKAMNEKKKRQENSADPKPAVQSKKAPKQQARAAETTKKRKKAGKQQKEGDPEKERKHQEREVKRKKKEEGKKKKDALQHQRRTQLKQLENVLMMREQQSNTSTTDADLNESDGDSSDEYHPSSSGEETDSEVEGIHPGRTVSSTATAAICKKSLISVPRTSVGTKSKSSNNNRSPTHAQCTPTTENNCFRSMQQSTLLPLHRPTASLFTPAPQSNAPRSTVAVLLQY